MTQKSRNRLWIWWTSFTHLYVFNFCNVMKFYGRRERACRRITLVIWDFGFCTLPSTYFIFYIVPEVPMNIKWWMWLLWHLNYNRKVGGLLISVGMFHYSYLCRMCRRYWATMILKYRALESNYHNVMKGNFCTTCAKENTLIMCFWQPLV